MKELNGELQKKTDGINANKTKNIETTKAAKQTEVPVDQTIEKQIKTESKIEKKKKLDKKLEEGRKKVKKAVGEETKSTENKTGQMKIAEPKPAAADATLIADQKWKKQYINTNDFPVPIRLVEASVKKNGVKEKEYRVYFQITEQDLERKDNFFDNEMVELRMDVDELKSLEGEKIRDMWKDYDPERPGYVPAITELNAIRNATLNECLRNAGKTMDDFIDTQKNGGETGKTYKFLKEIGAWEMYKKLDMTKLFHQYNEHRINNVLNISQKIPRADVNSNSSIDLSEYSYETQGPQNCFCCSLSAIYNHFVSTDPVLKNDKTIPKLNQEKVRSFEPRYLGSKEVKGYQNEWEKKDAVEQGRSQVGYYAGAGKQTAGNILDISDVLYESRENGGMERKDIALVEKNYYLSRLNGKDDATQTIKNNVMIDLKKQIHKGIDSGQMVSIVAHGHYVTIISLKGNECRYLESSSSTPTIPKVKDIDEVLKGGSKDYSNVGISFIRKITDADKENLKNEYLGFGIDEASGEVIKTNGIVNDADTAHRMGIVITKNTDELISQGDADIANYISENICLNKTAFMNVDQKKSFDEKNDQGWNEAKAEWDEIRKQKREQEKLALQRHNEQEQKKKEAKAAKKAAETIEKEKKAAFDNVFAQKEKKEFANANAKLIESEYNLATKTKITPEEKEGYLRTIRLLKSFDKKMKDKELNDLTKKLIHFNPEGNDESDLAVVNTIERLFLNILNFDVKELEARDYDGMVEKMNKYSELFDFASDESSPLIEAYRNRSIKGYETAVNTVGVELVKKRLGLIRQYRNFYHISLLLKKEHEKTHTEMGLGKKSIDDLSIEEISAELSNKELKPEQLNYYSLGLSVKTEGALLNEMKNEKAETGQMELLLDNLSKSVTAYDDQRSLIERVQDSAMAYTKHRKLINQRLVRAVSSEADKYNEKAGYAAILASKFNGDDDGVAAKLYGALKKGAPKANATKEEKQKFIDAIEVMAAAVMNFDMSKFAAESGAEFYRTDDRYADCKDIIELSDYLLPLLDNYEELSKDEGLKAVLDADKLTSIQVRAKIYSDGKVIFSQYADNKIQNDTDAFYISEMEKRETEEIKQALEQKRGEERTLAADKALANLTANAKSYVNSGSFLGVSQNTLYDLADEHKLRGGISQNLREKKMKNRRSELYKKAGAADAIVEASKVFRGDMAKRRREISFGVSSLIKEEKFKALSAYFGEDKMENSDMVRQLKQNKNALMDRITQQFLNVRLDNIDMSTDEKLIESTGRLEEINQKLLGYKSLIDGDEAYKERLRKTADEEGTLLDKVQRQIRELSAVTEYYRVRKLLITNPYYMSHYHDELSPIYKNTDSREQKEASRLILLSIECARRMKTVFGDRSQGADIAYKDFLAATEGQENMSEVRATINDQSELGDGMEGYISSLEEKYRIRSYATGRIDTSLCTKENLDAFFKEIMNIKKKGRLTTTDHKMATEAYKDVMKKASPAVSQLLKYWMFNGSQGVLINYSKEKYPGLFEEMNTLSTDFKKGRGNDYSTGAKFNNKFSGTSYELGINLNRIHDSFSRMSESEGMSDDEAMEIFEGFNIANWKDYDPNDEQQVKAAEDRYLRSLAKYCKMVYEYNLRFINTYGLMADQMPAPLLAICMPDSLSELRLRSDAANIDDLVRKSDVKNGGVKKDLWETLVEKGYIEAGIVESFKKTCDHLSGTVAQIGGEVIDTGNFIINDTDDEEEDNIEENKHNDSEMVVNGVESSIDAINSHRGDYEGWEIPRLSEEEEKNGWKLLRGMTNISKDSFMERESSYLKAVKKENERVKSLNSLNRYVTALIGVDTDGHSDKYIAMNSKLSVLVNTLSNLAVSSGVEKNISKNEILMLRRMYGELIESSKTYLKGKNREHKNELYRRRYDIVDDMIKVLEKDYTVLNDQRLDKRYSLSDVLTSARSETVSVDSDKVEKYHGAMSTRNMFTMEINGEQKKLAFTKREKLLSVDQLENRYKEFKKSTDEYKTFPQLAWIADKMNRDYLDAFFRKPAVRECILYIKKTKGVGEQTKEKRELLEKEFADYLGALWDKHHDFFIENSAYVFHDKSGNVLKNGFTSLISDERENIMRHMESIGIEYIDYYDRKETYESAGIGVGSNIEKRNVAMSIVATELGAEKNIAYSQLANVDIREEGKETKGEEGILMEWIEGYSIEQVYRGIRDGEVVCEDEDKLIEQLSNIQVIDYICGNIDRHSDNIKMKMSDTGRKTASGRPILKIESIVGIDNDLSFGKLDPQNIEGYKSRLTPPECMQIMSRDMANKILTLNKDNLFIMLGSTITEDEKKAMWARVEYLRLAIQRADTEGKQGNLKILNKDDFKEISLKELGMANSEVENIYRIFATESGFKGTYSGDNPHRYACKEQRIDIKLDMIYESGRSEYVGNNATILWEKFLSLSRSKRQRILTTELEVTALFSRLQAASREFSESIGSLFNKVSASRNYNSGHPRDERADLFSNEYSRAHGINSIVDIFYIDGKPASEVIPENVDAMAERIMQNPVATQYNGITKEGIKDMINKAFIMSYISMGHHQVTIANYQNKRDGSEELVISDLNVFVYTEKDCYIASEIMGTDERGNGKLIRKARKNRTRNHNKIRENMEARRHQQGQQ